LESRINVRETLPGSLDERRNSTQDFGVWRTDSAQKCPKIDNMQRLL
jgi:hypothetical protein